MNPTGFTIIASSLLGAALSATGMYLIIDNLIQPQGLLFEGIVMLGLGFILILMVTIAVALGNTMITFADIMNKQAEIQKDMRSFTPNSTPNPISEIIKKMMENPQSFTVQPIITTNGFRIDDDEEDMYSDMSLDELESRLADAIKKDDYESAEEINKEIKKRKKNEE
jgi:hypothetical protein